MSDQKAMFIEGHRSGTQFRACGLAWTNGTACPAEIAAQLRREGYHLRPAAPEEIFHGELPLQVTELFSDWRKRPDAERAGA